MTAGIKECGKIPVAYFLLDGLCGQEHASIVLICVSKLQAVGIRAGFTDV